MRNIKEVLTDLNPNLFSNIVHSYCTIYKIDTNSDAFNELSSQYKQLENAIYMINPNSNNSEGSIFLSKTGLIIYEANFFANLLPNTSLDFELNIPNYTNNHPLSEILNADYNF